MRPKICVPILAPTRGAIVREAAKIARLPVEMAEWRVDFFAGYEREIPSVAEELKKTLGDKELVVTLRTVHEGGEDNGDRFDYFSLICSMLGLGVADYVDVEISRDAEKIKDIRKEYRNSPTKVIGSFHDFNSTPSEAAMTEKLETAKELGCHVGKLACMPVKEEDVDALLLVTDRMWKRYPDFPLITMSMGKMGERSRRYGGLYGSTVSFGCVSESSAPGQIHYQDMLRTFDKLYSGKRHISLIGFMGAGKSTVARELQRQSGWTVIDTDCWIVEQEGREIAEIFETEGEAYFRDLETSMLDEAAAVPAILSCGGGMVLRDLNVRKLREMGDVVLLTAEPETIFERVRYSSERPLLNGNMHLDYIQDRMRDRLPFYERAATLQVKTDARPAEEIAKEILEKCC